MPSGLDNARALYLEGIRDGDYERAIEAYSGARYTQHSHPVPDGKEGFKRFFAEFARAHPKRDVQILRSFQDGQYVFLHVTQVLDGGSARWITMDMFDTDEDGRLIEHWDMISALTEDTEVAGPTEVTDGHQTEHNKNVVRRFLEQVCVRGDVAAAPQFLDVEAFRHHTPGVAVGAAGFLSRLGVDGSHHYLDVRKLIGSGCFVAVMAHVDDGGDDSARMDLYRLAAGRIVEHWESAETIVPRDEWVNSGKF